MIKDMQNIFFGLFSDVYVQDREDFFLLQAKDAGFAFRVFLDPKPMLGLQLLLPMQIEANLPILPGFRYKASFSSVADIYGLLSFARAKVASAYKASKKQHPKWSGGSSTGWSLDDSLFLMKPDKQGNYHPFWGPNPCLSFYIPDSRNHIQESCSLGERLLRSHWTFTKSKSYSDGLYTSSLGLYFDDMKGSASFANALHLENEYYAEL